MTIRIIPRLDIKGPNLVKGIHLEGLRVLGKPERFARYYYEQGADELLYMDVVASLYGRNNLLEIVRKTANEIFIPLTVGGGLRTLEDIREVLRAGADKVSLNTAAIHSPDLIRQAAQRFGSSTIVISIEAIRHSDGTYEAYTDNGRERTGVDAIEWAQRVEELGAGEILLTSIDREGTGKGFDVELTRQVAERVSIPVIAGGGAGKLSDVCDVIVQGKADAVCVASILHYRLVREVDMSDDFSEEGNIEYLKTKRGFSKIQDTTLPILKACLRERGVGCRDVSEPVTKLETTMSREHSSPLNADRGRVAIVDYGMGNLFSVQRACEHAGLQAVITSSPQEVMAAHAVMLPGVGAFGDAMSTLHRLGLVDVLREAAASGKPLMGICLGMQLLMTESSEFGCHQGLGIIDGEVVRLQEPAEGGAILKVPQVGWNRVFKSPHQPWDGTPLEGRLDGTWMYFVHSFYVKPVDPQVICAVTRYGRLEFCSSLRRGNLFACQFHPERSGPDGLQMYRAFAKQIAKTMTQEVLSQ